MMLSSNTSFGSGLGTGLSSNRILKSYNYDADNKVVIDNGSSASEFDGDYIDTGSLSDAEDSRMLKEEAAKKNAARIVRHAESQAEEIVSKARKDSAAEIALIRQKAEQEAAMSVSQATDAGYQEGLEAANREGEAIKADAQKCLEDAKNERQAMQESLEPEIVNMIIGITEKLLGNITQVNPAAITNLVRQGFASTSLSGDVTVYVSAQDYEQVIEQKDELLALTDGSVKLEITKDLSLSPMDCMISTPYGDIDCSLGQQFESLRANLTYILNNK